MNKSFVVMITNADHRKYDDDSYQKMTIVPFENFDHIIQLSTAKDEPFSNLEFLFIARDYKELIDELTNSYRFFPSYKKLIAANNTVLDWTIFLPAVTEKQSLSLLLSDKTLKEVFENDIYKKNRIEF